MRTTSTADDRSRFLFGEDATSLQYNGSASSTPLRPTDYYFPSDESLFNMDSFFDDFVEIDTSDIFESTEFININSGAPGRKCDTAASSASATLVLPDIHQQQQQQQQSSSSSSSLSSTSSSSSSSQRQRHRSQYSANENLDQHHQLRVLRNIKSFPSTLDDTRKQYFRATATPSSAATANPDSGSADVEINFSARRAFLQAGHQNMHHEPEADGGIASIIQHIDREQLGETTTVGDASCTTFHDDSKERLLRLTDYGKPAAAGGTSAGTAQHHTTDQIKSKKLRCAQCNKKLGVIMIMKCHCEKMFCAQHRYAEAHNCSYDFKVEGRKVLEKNNPLVVADKLPKI